MAKISAYQEALNGLDLCAETPTDDEGIPVLEGSRTLGFGWGKTNLLKPREPDMEECAIPSAPAPTAPPGENTDATE